MSDTIWIASVVWLVTVVGTSAFWWKYLHHLADRYDEALDVHSRISKACIQIWRTPDDQTGMPGFIIAEGTFAEFYQILQRENDGPFKDLTTAYGTIKIKMMEGE